MKCPHSNTSNDPLAGSTGTLPNAGELNAMVAAVERELKEARTRSEYARVEERRRLVEELAQTRLSDAEWRDLMIRARSAASAGSRELIALRFPAELCADGGRAVNAPDPAWPETLRGVPADLYDRWERELKPLGYRLSAQILNFPDGFLGEVGLSIRWG